MTQEFERASKYIEDLKAQMAKYRSDMDAMQMRTTADAEKSSSLSQSLATATRELADVTYKYESLVVCLPLCHIFDLPHAVTSRPQPRRLILFAAKLLHLKRRTKTSASLYSPRPKSSRLLMPSS